MCYKRFAYQLIMYFYNVCVYTQNYVIFNVFEGWCKLWKLPATQHNKGSYRSLLSYKLEAKRLVVGTPSHKNLKKGLLKNQRSVTVGGNFVWTVEIKKNELNEWISKISFYWTV